MQERKKDRTFHPVFGITLIIYELSLICKYLCLYCSVVGSGYRERDVYCIYEVKNKNNVQKICYYKNTHVFLNVPTSFFVKMYTFWKSINYCCTLLL